ncbi:MAG TPA: thiaminase II [Kiloniellales bacterium]|nr:thiaminase II [Kiloniellales bacterium]
MTLFEALKRACHEEWEAYVEHAFVRQIADGSLPEASFRHYLAQDYVFLLNFARAAALAVVKSEQVEDLQQSAALVDLLLNTETPLHLDYCARWGMSREEVAATPEADANRLYTRYVLDRGISGDLLDLLVALVPCTMGYAEIGRRLMADPATRLEGNPYRDWIELYSGKEFQEGTAAHVAQLNRVAGQRGVEGEVTASGRWPSLVENFRTATRLEIGFWEMGLNP